jgi:hypothetical protein
MKTGKVSCKRKSPLFGEQKGKEKFEENIKLIKGRVDKGEKEERSTISERECPNEEKKTWRYSL